MATSAPLISDRHPLIAAQTCMYRYVPAMRTKAGEITALENLPSSVCDRILPLFHITEELKVNFLPSLAAAWPRRLVAIDGSFNFAKSGSTATFVAAVGKLRADGVLVMPCWSVNDPTAYRQTAASLVDAQGAMLRTSLAGIGGVAAHLAQQGIPSQSVDLLIDLGHLGGIEYQSFGSFVAFEISSHARQLGAYRSITLTGASAPKDHSGLIYGTNVLPRKEWHIWQIVRAAVGTRIDYGDFLTAHPDLTEPPGAAMAKATVSVRYTRDNDFLILKGYATTGPMGQPMAQQYRAHAGTIQSSQGFAGVNAWADGQISLAAGGAPRLGSRSKWSGFAANRHISLVIGRLP